jgi:hypothetical protein
VADAPPHPSSADDISQSTVAPYGWITPLVDGLIGYEWHDAVAIVQQLAEQCVANGIRTGVPGPDDIALERDGRLRVTFDASATESAVHGLGQLLNQLLNGRPAPAMLRLIGSQAVSRSTTIESISDLKQRLAPFERPDRLGKLAALHARASLAGVWAQPPPKPQAPVPEPPKPEPSVVIAEPPPASPEPRSSLAILRNRDFALGAVAIVASVVLVVVTWAILPGESSTDRRVPAVARAAGEAIEITPSAIELAPDASRTISVNTSRGAASQPSGRSSGPPRDTVPSPGNRRPVARADQVRGDRGIAPPAGRTTNLAAPQPSGQTDVLSASRASGAGNLAAGGAPGSVEDRVYTIDDAGVEQPVLMRPYFPQPLADASPDARQGVLDLVIDKGGLVESVRLRSPANRYRERWWVSVAKNWQFRPAFKDGQPVKFRKQIVITDFPEPIK